MSRDSIVVTPGGERKAVRIIAAAISCAGTGFQVAGAKRSTCSASRSIGRDSARSPAITDGRTMPRLGQRHGAQGLLHLPLHARVEEPATSASAPSALTIEKCARALRKRQLRQLQRDHLVDLPELLLRTRLADRRAERAEHVVGAQLVAHLAEVREVRDHLPQLRVPGRRAEIAAGDHRHPRILFARKELLQALPTHEAGRAGQHGGQALHFALGG